MLQWMGGSRRKVTTSRKSTHKRQRQYFEQRKQQQQQQIAGFERYSDGKRPCTPQCDYSRSLDILSLENVSTVAQEHKISRITARDNSENDDFTLISQAAFPSQVILTGDSISVVDQSEINRECTPSSHTAEAEYPEKIHWPQLYRVSIPLPNHDENLVGNFNKLDSFKLSMSDQISVIDLLGDGANTNAEENSLHEQEAHVAFSVEGLGQVETETPVHSPNTPGRSFMNCYTPPKNAARVPLTTKHLDYGFHDLGLDIDFSPCESTIDPPFCTRDLMNAAGDPKQNFLNFSRPCSPYNWNSSNVQGVLKDDELLYNSRDSSRRSWQGPSFLDDGIDDLGEYESFSTNFDRREVGFGDYILPGNRWKQDLNLERWDLNKNRSSMKRPEVYNVKELSDPYPEHIIMEDLRGIGIPDKRWRSGFEINNGLKEAVDNSATEDSRERSLLSEESCSSTAARGAATKKS